MSPDTTTPLVTINGHCTCACGCQEAPQYAFGLCVDCWGAYMRRSEDESKCDLPAAPDNLDKI